MGRRLLFLVLLVAWTFAHAESLLVIANDAVPVDSISAGDLASIYLIRTIRWGGGMAIVPVNREASSAARRSFSEEVVGQSPADLADYWNRLRFEGKRPPLVQTSDQAVIGFVHNVPGAIGYVSARVQISGVKVLLRLP